MISYQSYDAGAASSLTETVIVPLYEDIYAARLSDPFSSAERFRERVKGYLSSRTFAMTAAYADGLPVGQALGCNLSARGSWDDLLTPVPEGFTDEAGGTRTFSLNEIMVREPWRRRGVARRLHDLLLAGRAEERATLLVRPENDAAQAAYAHWGWRKVGQYQPTPDAPVFDVLILLLRTARAADL